MTIRRRNGGGTEGEIATGAPLRLWPSVVRGAAGMIAFFRHIDV